MTCALHLALLCLCGNQIWMFRRMKIKPQFPAHFHEVSCLFKRWVWADVADEGQMWITTVQTLSSQKWRVTVLLCKTNWSVVLHEISLMALVVQGFVTLIPHVHYFFSTTGFYDFTKNLSQRVIVVLSILQAIWTLCEFQQPKCKYFLSTPLKSLVKTFLYHKKKKIQDRAKMVLKYLNPYSLIICMLYSLRFQIYYQNRGWRERYLPFYQTFPIISPLKLL